jgi:hypothetical protein
MGQQYTDYSRAEEVNTQETETKKTDAQIPPSMKFYCAGAIRGELFYQGYFDKIIKIVEDFGEALTEKKLYDIYSIRHYAGLKKEVALEKLVAERDRQSIMRSRAVIAEFSGPSTGTGWEICYATRIHRKPTLCLHNVTSNARASLIIKQDDCDYSIVQPYSNELEFETYVRCFLEIVTRLDGIDEIRKMYFKSREIVKTNPDPGQIKEFVESLIAKSPKQARIEFTDADQMIQFLFRNLILQKRWSHLKSQEIGSTFVSGEKPRIIKILSQVGDRIGIYELYDREKEYKTKYTREAFTKNVRAFRRIGLIRASKAKLPYSKAARFKDKIVFVKTIDSGDLQILSSRSSSKRASNLIYGTQHLQQLAEFINRFGADFLVEFLQRSEKKSWHSDIPDMSVHNIDETNLSQFLEHKWARELAEELHLECKSFWEKTYSTFGQT